ncbi:MAG: aryl-sulfate sulfotransferase [Oscillospiraceae bacterium]|nr:aryl-sulfate sulfotransferase [Oscillospiraceae bacterium]
MNKQMVKKILKVLGVVVCVAAVVFWAIFLPSVYVPLWMNRSASPAGDEAYENGYAIDVADARDGAHVIDQPVSGAVADDMTFEGMWIDDAQSLFAFIRSKVERQARVDEMLLRELNSGYFTFDDPLVVVDPYGTAPLSALALFQSEEPMMICVHVPGRTELADVDFTFDGYNTSHQIPIFGLYPGTLNVVTLTGRTQAGVARSVRIELQTDLLPPELAGDIILTDLVAPESIQPGFNFTFAYKTAFDVHGDYRWFYNDFWLRGFAMYDYNGHMIFAKGSYHEGDVLLMEVNMLGKVLSVFHSPYGMHHDVTSRNGGNLIVNGSHGATVEDFIYEIDVHTGEIVNRLDLRRVLQRTRTEGFPKFDPVDWFHHNATVYEDGMIIISGRRQSTVAKLTWPYGEIQWILSDPVGWNPMFHQYLLTPVGADFEWSYGQHTPQILPDLDNNPDTIDILLFDNGNGRFDHDHELLRRVAIGEIYMPELYSRMVHYRINEREMTIEQIWQFGKELGYTYFSEGWSSAVLLENGNRLGAFDRYIAAYGGSVNANIVEVDTQGNIIWEAFGTSTSWNGSFHVYRVARLPLYTQAANDLRIGVPARVFLPW